jgi:hypothetical protein
MDFTGQENDLIRSTVERVLRLVIIVRKLDFRSVTVPIHP